MGVSWPFVVLLLYPALQVPALWFVVHRFDLRNDDGPRDPRGYNFEPRDRERVEGECHRCGHENDPTATYCARCLTAQR